jgi:hypothetical protein
MSLALLILLVISAGALAAYTMKMADVVKVISKNAVRLTKSIFYEMSPQWVESALRTRAQGLRFIILFILILTISICGFVFFQWNVIIFIVFTVVLSIIITWLLPPTNSAFYKDKIRRELIKDQSHYEKIGDEETARDKATVIRIIGKL